MGAPEVAVVVPVKGGPLAKSRLHLPLPHRRALAEAFARDTLEAVREGAPDALVVVVTADAGVSAWAAGTGCEVVPDPGGGLDAAVAAGLGAVAARGGRWSAVLLGDHPALRAAEVAGALGALRTSPPAVVADADGTGTALLTVRLGPGTQAPTRFGPGSAQAHRDLGYAAALLSAPGLRTDVDDAGSLADAVRIGVGRHTRTALARATLPGVQATIHRAPTDEPGSALLDDGLEVAVPPAAVVSSGLLHLRVGQRVSIELDEAGTSATAVWVVGIGPGETIR